MSKMKTKSCYGCGTPIPELRMNNGKYSFYCSRCTCATKEYGNIFEALLDWNNGVTIPEDGKKFWDIIKPW